VLLGGSINGHSVDAVLVEERTTGLLIAAFG
jgi:hypothetical protein